MKTEKRGVVVRKIKGLEEWIAIVHELGPKFAERAIEHDNNDTFVMDNYRDLKEKKFFSAAIPAELGGGGLTHGEMCSVLRELAGHCGSTALTLSMSQHLIAAAVWKYRRGQPGKEMLEKVAANELILISTGANDWLASNGTMKRVDGGYLVSAKKTFASGCLAGDVLVTSAVFDDKDEGSQVLHFSVPFSADGLSIAENWKVLGMRGTGSHTVVLEDVFVPEEAIVMKRPSSTFHPVWNVVLTVAMPLITSVYVGIAEKAVDIVRKNAARKINDPVAPYILGEMENALTTAQMAQQGMVEIANNLDFEPENENANEILKRKTIAGKAVLETVEKAVESSGGFGFLRSVVLERLLRDVHAFQFHPLSEKRQLLFTGRIALGLDPSVNKIE
ncbi:MAG: acyl-CoA dehydrogenase [Nitrospinaceae bacterium]|nr:acyl-CoA dehydrogenase [Nitrospinaceae bacterium]MBT3822176.1 acyl-CoA dehydrogenase [Nitrospinaceae bacterium]MBT4094636.1 acyl-CoA dehydrogenase [Nitrospinaceae bacterium]MBT4431994.1 acyl-CoA dehydrogenase [Nitrospinaceae bacterium]MBT5366600.1 acyl-CoA dehydrogenase [Nitrospinaceae bacterium]